MIATNLCPATLSHASSWQHTLDHRLPSSPPALLLQPAPPTCPPCPRSSPPALARAHLSLAAPATPSTLLGPRLLQRQPQRQWTPSAAARCRQWHGRTRSPGSPGARVRSRQLDRQPDMACTGWHGGVCAAGQLSVCHAPLALPYAVSTMPFADSMWAAQPLRQDSSARSSDYPEAAGTSPRGGFGRQTSNAAGHR